MVSGAAIIALDPGHGGGDPGAVSPSGLREKDITLKIAQQVVKLLGGRGTIAVLTRGSDKDVFLQDRAKFANDSNADVFVSIHCNAATNPVAHGLEAFYFHGSGAGQRLATAILDRLVLETLLPNRGVKESGFAVLRLTDMPATLVECGFLTNAHEEKLLRRDDFCFKCARAIADGIATFLGIEKPSLGNILPWAENSVNKAIKIRLVANPELLNESEQKCLVWLDRLGLLSGGGNIDV